MDDIVTAPDVNAGVDPRVAGNAYTNSVAGATETQQFVLDFGLNTLATLANNAGTLATVATVTLDGHELDFRRDVGFDIFTDPEGTNTAYAVLQANGERGLYTIDLANGAATSLGDLGVRGRIEGLAIQAGADGESPVGYALGNNGRSLLRFDVDDPGTVERIALSGDGRSLDAIDFRPATGELFGYDDRTDSHFTVDLSTGVLTAASAVSTETDTAILDMDWNPTIDRLRVVTQTDQNIVFNPETGIASDAATMPLFYDAADDNAGVDPRVAANAYTNSVAGATETQQFVLDHGLNTLATLANNAGTLATVATVTLDGAELDFRRDVGFDIFTDPDGTNTAYAVLQANGDRGLYTIDLASGAATSLGDLGVRGRIEGPAIQAGTDGEGPVGYALGNNGRSLLRFDVDDPGTVERIALSGDGRSLDAIDFRPATDELFGYDDRTDSYFTVDLSTGALTAASAVSTPTDTAILDEDWNPTIDRLRVVTQTDQNIVFNPETGIASDAATMPLFYEPGDAGAAEADMMMV